MSKVKYIKREDSFTKVDVNLIESICLGTLLNSDAEVCGHRIALNHIDGRWCEIAVVKEIDAAYKVMRDFAEWTGNDEMFFKAFEY